MNGYRQAERRATNWLGIVLAVALLFVGLLAFSAAVDALSGLTTPAEVPTNSDVRIVEVLDSDEG